MGVHLPSYKNLHRLILGILLQPPATEYRSPDRSMRDRLRHWHDRNHRTYNRTQPHRRGRGSRVQTHGESDTVSDYPVSGFLHDTRRMSETLREDQQLNF